MPKKKSSDKTLEKMPLNGTSDKIFYLEFLNAAQKMAWDVYQRHDISFFLGCSGVGKTWLATAFALQELFAGNVEKIILTRPAVEAGERLGYLPGLLAEKYDPYMLPLYDCMTRMVGSGSQRQFVQERVEIAPLAFLRGRTLNDCVCILDEAQNCTWQQLLLYLTRLGNKSKMIVTGDPYQSDIYHNLQEVPLIRLVDSISTVHGIGVVEFSEKYVVRHSLIGKILKKLRDCEAKEKKNGRDQVADVAGSESSASPAGDDQAAQ
jgi:phosphate starvation-inducible PhoH-like protein